jgi:hypothetical protein
MKWIVLDFGTHRLKALKCEVDNQKVRILDFAEWDSRPDYFRGLGFPDAQAWAAMTVHLNEVEWIQPEEDYVVTAALPSAYLETRYLRFPFKNEKQIEKVLHFELESLLPFDVEDLLVRHKILEGDGLSHKKDGLVLSFCYKRDYVKSWETELKKFQVSSPPVTTEILSLAALKPPAVHENLFGLLEVGHSKTQFLILQKSGNVLAARTFIWGTGNLIQSIATGLKLDFAQAEAAYLKNFDEPSEQVNACLHTAIEGFAQEWRQNLKGFMGEGLKLPQPLHIYVMGRSARHSEFIDLIQTNLHHDPALQLERFPVESLFQKTVQGGEVLGADPDKALPALAFILSQSRTMRGRIPLFSESSYQFQQNLKRIRSSSLQVVRKVAILLIAPFLYSVFQFVIQERENVQVLSQIQENLQRVGLREIEAQSAQDVVRQLRRESQLNQLKVEQMKEDLSSPLAILTQISQIIPANLKIDVKEFRVSESLVTLKAQVPTSDSAESIATELRKWSPQLKMGALTTCTASPQCKEVTFELPRSAATEEVSP